MRQKRLVAEVVAGAPTLFLTLTIRRSQAKSPNEAAAKLSDAFQTLRSRIMRWHRKKRLPFFAVFEAHVSGWPHLHIFLRSGWLSQVELSCWMSHLIDSPIVHIRKIDNKGRAAWYAAKYTSKENVRFGNAKRYWQSPDYDLRPEPAHKTVHLPGLGWEMDKRDVHAFARDWHALGWSVEWLAPHKCHARAPP